MRAIGGRTTANLKDVEAETQNSRYNDENLITHTY